MPVFPLDGVVLLPHATIRLFIFEPRYRQMVSDVLDGPGLLALATFDGERWQEDYDGSPPIRPAVCVGQVIHHEGLPDGTSRIWVRGVCRARVVEDHEPDGDRLYRAATVEPVERPHHPDLECTGSEDREGLLALVRTVPLSELPAVRSLVDQLQSHEGGVDAVPTSVLLDLIALGVLAGLGDRELMYRLLEEACPSERSRIVAERLGELASIVRLAGRQFDAEAPTGVSWN
jgi:Lon protease-like protein